jgi:hypothetical protein
MYSYGVITQTALCVLIQEWFVLTVVRRLSFRRAACIALLVSGRDVSP